MTATMNATLAQTKVLGHLALHYLPGNERAARRLLELMGATLVDNGPDPGNDGFCTILLDGATGNHADNIMFMSPARPSQVALEEAIASSVPQQAVDGYLASTVTNPESISHIGIRYASLEKLEDVLAGLKQASGPGGELEGQIEFSMYRARRGLDAAVDARMDASPVFDGTESEAFANHWIQCFVKTKIVGFGLLSFGQIFELDYVFEPFFDEAPSFGRKKA
jgi:hypothetical protein